MRKEITISELAKLMNVSVHQIRYFEEKGVLYPAYIDENQYRMYGIDQIYQLAQILMLRKLELSVQAIGSISDAETSPDDIQELLLRSASRIEAEISRLQTLHSFIYKVLGEKKRFAQDNTFFEVIQRDEMALSLCVEMEHETELNARMLFQKRDKLTQLFETDVHYVYEEDYRVKLCTADRDGDIIVPAGKYIFLIYPFMSATKEWASEKVCLNGCYRKQRYDLKAAMLAYM